ncbi:MAG: hypothetical protein PHS42_00910 [Sulfurimonas sp.]|nr:hypothetical protein [Sulfurimonas sp.]MDD3834005.1 hypothetical protein [Sulfurimonas sp.]
MAQNSKDVLFKSKVNNYISEKLSQSGTVPAFLVTSNSINHYIGTSNGDVSLSIDNLDYIYTPTIGNPVSPAFQNPQNIEVDFITLNAYAEDLNGKNIIGSGIVNVNIFESTPANYLTGVNTSVLKLNIEGGSTSPVVLNTLEFGSPTVGRIFTITSGEVALDAGVLIPANTSIIVESGATLTLTAAQASGASISGNVNILNSLEFSFTDTGSSDEDGITSNGVIELTLATSTASWKYSIDAGATWIDGVGISFTLPEGTYDKQKIQVKQFDGAGFTGSSTISPMSTLTDSSMVQLEVAGVTGSYKPQITALENGEFVVTFRGESDSEENFIFVQKFNEDGTISGMVQLNALNPMVNRDYSPQITALTNGEFAVTFRGKDNAEKDFIYVQKFNADGTTNSNDMVQLEALNASEAYNYDPQITALANGEFVVTFYGIDSEEDNSIFVQKFNAAGEVIGDMTQLEALGVTDKNDDSPQITALSNGEFVVTFKGVDSNHKSFIFVQKFSADATVIGSMVQLGAIGATDNDNNNPQIAALANGEFVVTFDGKGNDNYNSIFVQKFNASGAVVGSMIELSASNAVNHDYSPQITALSSGDFVVTFFGIDSNGDNSIFVQKFNEGGAAVGSMVQLDAIDVTDKADIDPQITALLNGEFVVTFSGKDSGGGDSIFVQKFNSAGATVGSMVQLEALNALENYNSDPQITALANGEFVVTFSGVDSEEGRSIFVQKFNADGTIAPHPDNRLIVDKTAPSTALIDPITSTDTDNNSTGDYGAGDKITISFSELVDKNTLALNDIVLTNSHSFGAGATLTAINPSGDFASTFEITLGITPTVEVGDTITVASSKAFDIAGNENSSAITYNVPEIATFTLGYNSGTVTFDGTTVGNILMSISGSTAVFTKGNISTDTISMSNIQNINLASNQILEGSAADLHDIIIDGTGRVVVNSSAGDQTLKISTKGTNSITAGIGSDTIKLGDVDASDANTGADTIIIASGDSTTVAPDAIYLFELDKDRLNLPSTDIANDVTSWGSGSNTEDTDYNGVSIGQMSIINGIVTFKAADDTTPVSINSADALTAAISYLSTQIADGKTVAFEYNIDTEQQGTYIFQGDASEDIVVNLIGTTVTDLSAILI